MKIFTQSEFDHIVATLAATSSGDRTVITAGGISWELESLKRTSFHSGRRLFKVTCLRCQKVIHTATNGPVYQMKDHVNELHSGMELKS